VSRQLILGHSDWQLQFTCTLEETQTALRAFPFAAVLSEGRLSDGHFCDDRWEQAALRKPPKSAGCVKGDSVIRCGAVSSWVLCPMFGFKVKRAHTRYSPLPVSSPQPFCVFIPRLVGHWLAGIEIK
jgi:hypothetical protein